MPRRGCTDHDYRPSRAFPQLSICSRCSSTRETPAPAFEHGKSELSLAHVPDEWRKPSLTALVAYVRAVWKRTEAELGLESSGMGRVA